MPLGEFLRCSIFSLLVSQECKTTISVRDNEPVGYSVLNHMCFMVSNKDHGTVAWLNLEFQKNPSEMLMNTFTGMCMRMFTCSSRRSRWY